MKKVLYLIFCSIIVTAYQLVAQNDTIILKGFVKDTINGEVLPFTEIRIDNIINSNYSTQTDFNGFFKIKISKSDFSNKEHKLFFYNIYGYIFSPKNINIQSIQDTIIIYGIKGIPLLSNDPVEFAEPLINPKTESCEINIGTWFEPYCQVDTCTNTNWTISYSDKCNIFKVLYKVYNPTKTKVIYKSNKVWQGKTNTPLGFYKADYYPYEITFYTKDNKVIKKQGKVYLHIW